MKGFKLILKNSTKNTFANRSQFAGLTLLIVMFSLVISLMSTISTRVLNSYNEFKDQSNLHNAVLKLDPFEMVPTGDVKGYSDAPTNRVEAQEYWVYKLQQQYYNTQLSFDWSRTEAREFSQVYGKDQSATLTLKVISKINPTNVCNQVDSLVINKGRNFESNKREVVLDQGFATKNNLVIGDIVRFQKDTFGENILVGSKNDSEELKADLQTLKSESLDLESGLFASKYSTNNWFQIVGFGDSADFSMPIINQSTVLPDKNKQGLIYIDSSFLGLSLDAQSTKKYGFNMYTWNNAHDDLTITSNNEWESFYSFKLNQTFPSSQNISKMNNDFKTLIGKKDSDKKIVFALNDKGYLYDARTSTIETTMKVYNTISAVILVIILFVCLYTMGLITKKQIDKARAQVGTMKALGQKKRQIIFTFVTTPMFASIIGGLAGYILSQITFVFISRMFGLYFSLNIPGWSFDPFAFCIALFLIWMIMTAIAFLIAFLILRKDALSLLSANKKPKMNKFGIMIKKMNLRNSFGSKMRTALLINSFGKMIGVGFVVVFASVFITISYLAPDILNRNKSESYNGVKYKQVVEYASPVYNNPYSFEKTFRPNDETYEYQSGKYSINGKEKDILTNIKLNDDKTFDLDQILKDYYNNEITNQYYTIDPQTDSEGNIDVSKIPDNNMKMLNSNYMNPTSDYFRRISQDPIALFNPDFMTGILMPTLFSQWPDYNDLLANIKQAKGDAKVEAQLLQSFYTKYKKTIALTLSKIDNKTWANSTEGILLSAAKAKENLGLSTSSIDQEKINMITLSKIDSGRSDKTKGDGNFILTDENNVDYSYLKVDKLSEQQLEIFTSTIASWYGMLFAGRMDEAVIQSGYTRAPYFVSEYMKSAYDNNKQYNLAFGLTPFTHETEQLGTFINASYNNFDFKIYGIENNNDYIDLQDANHNNLVQTMYQSTDANAIVINESLAKKLNIKVGQTIDFKIIQEELEKYNNEVAQKQAFSLEDWKKGYVYDSNSGFAPFTEMENGQIKLQDMNLTSNIFGIKDGGVGDVLKAYSSKEIGIENLESNQTFKVVGVHNGYGTPQAWIKQTEANSVLSFDKVQSYMWKDQFVKQWNTQFSKLDKANSYQNQFAIANLDLRNVSLETFKNDFVNSKDAKIASAAKNVYQIFINEFPIFNYKYSLDDNDIGDLKRTVSTFEKLGDYSPIGLNGGKPVMSFLDDKNYTGIGEGTIHTILPVAMSQQILKQISDVIMAVLISMIILVLAITFIIILLTTSLIISDNSRFIATMKILGYKNKYIAKNILGMYLIVIMSTFTIGFAAGWFTFVKIVSSIWHSSSMVLPLSFPIWSVFAAFLSIVGIYLITIAIGFRSISKLDATKALQNQDF